MPYCTNCSSEVSNTASFCPECGLKLAARAYESSEVNSRSSCPSCGSGDKLRWSVLNKSWICDNCGRSFGTSTGFAPGGFAPPQRELYERSTASYREGGFPFSKAIAVTIILLVIGTAIGVPLWWFLPTFPLIVVTTPSDGGVVTGGGDYHRNTDVLITADPNECFEFSGWTGINIANQGLASTTVHVSSTGQVLTANFERYCIPPGADHPYWEYLSGSPDYLSLDNNELATDPSWSQLKAFLEHDDTDEKIYNEDRFNCVDFALLVHDNSEEIGIKAAFVEIDFVDEEVGHALNAFKTTDSGLIFVDCTGLEYSRSKYDKDTVAYVEVGKEYGLISLGVVEGFSYGNYERYMDEWEAYQKDVEEYNNEVDDYDRVLDSCGGFCTYEGGKCSCQTLWPWYDELERWRKQLDRRLNELGNPWEPLGIVEEVRIWW